MRSRNCFFAYGSNIMTNENELVLRFKTDEEWDLLMLLQVKAYAEGLSVEQYVINELKKSIEESVPPPPENPILSPTQMNEILRRIGNVDMSSRREISKIKREIATLAEAIAAIQAQIDNSLQNN